MSASVQLGHRQAQVLSELRKRGSLTARQAEHVIRAADIFERYQDAEKLHGTDDPWVTDLRRQFLRRLDHIEDRAKDLSHSADGKRILASLERRGLATSSGPSTWICTSGAEEADPGWDWLLGDLNDLFRSDASGGATPDQPRRAA